MSVTLCTVCGVIIGYIYDFFRLLRKNLNYNKLFSAISDIVFWVVSSILTVMAFFYLDGMVIRFYRFCAIGCGYILYLLFLSRFFIAVSENILKLFIFFLKILFTICSFCGRIFLRIFRIFLIPFLFLESYVKKFGISLKKIGKLRKRI